MQMFTYIIEIVNRECANNNDNFQCVPTNLSLKDIIKNVAPMAKPGTLITLNG